MMKKGMWNSLPDYVLKCSERLHFQKKKGGCAKRHTLNIFEESPRQGYSLSNAGSVRRVREHGKMPRGPLGPFFTNPLGSRRWLARSFVRGVMVSLLIVSLSSCVAQQADLVRFQREFEAKIAKLDQEKKNLEATLAEANKAIQESQAVLAKQKSEVSELIRARAQIKSELRSLREENLTRLSGELETESHRLQRLERSMDDMVQQIKALEGDVQQRDAARAKEIQTLHENVKKEFDRQNTIMSENMTAFRGALSEFKEAMAALETQLEQERARAQTAETHLKEDFEAQQSALQAKLDSDTKALKHYLETEVKASIGSVAKTLDEVHTTLSTQLDAQKTELGAQAKLLADLNAKVGTELAALKQQDQGINQNVENLSKSIAELRRGLNTVSTKLGSKIDEHTQSLKQHDGRFKQIEAQYTALSKKLDADTKALRAYLDKEIRPSLESLVKTVEAEQARTAAVDKKLEERFKQLEKATRADVQQAKAQLAEQDQYVKDLKQSVVGMREVLDSMAGMLGKRSDDQMQQLGKLTAQVAQIKQAQSAETAQLKATVETLSTHVQEVTTSVQALVNSLEQVKTSLSSRLDQQAAQLAEQDRRLANAGNQSLSVEELKKEAEANLQHLNQLTTALGQLKEVVNSIGTKLGKKIDEHEAQLAKLTQEIQRLEASPSPSEVPPQLPPPPQPKNAKP